MTDTKEYIKRVVPKVKVKCDIIEAKTSEKVIIDYIEKNQINLVALTRHKRGLLYKLFNPSLAKRMIYHSEVPVLLFHE
jgi:nucleotide-binding universal stress UspA family protein